MDYLVRSVGKIEARHVHSRINHLHEGIHVPARGTEGAHDFGVAVRKGSVLDNSVKTRSSSVSSSPTSNYNRYTT